MTNPALFEAIRRNQRSVVDGFLDEYPEQIDVRNLEGGKEGSYWDELTPIHVAAKYGHLELVKNLVDRGATVYSHPFNSYPAVALAAWEKHAEVVEYFLEDIPEKADGTFGVGITCNLAGRFGWLRQVQNHLDRDPLAVHQRGWIGDTPLHWPSHNGFIEIVRLLLDHGANPNLEENNWIGGTPLHWASERNSDIVRLLIERGADVNAQVHKPGSDHLGATPLIWCAKQRDDSAEVANALLELGADPLRSDAHGKLALDYAKPKVKKVLLASH